MLKTLYIRNYVLISEADIHFEKGMTAITGETGAGKSILLGAIALILGARADTKLLKEGEKKCVIEAAFDIQEMPEILTLLEENDLDADDNICLMRRELSATGKSRAFICDTPVTTQLMKQVGERLMDVHSQHSNMLIASPAFQVGMLDVVSDNLDTLESYQEVLSKYKNLYKEWQNKVQDLEQKRQDREYLAFQYNELCQANLVDNEEIELEDAWRRMQHTQEIAESLLRLTALDEDDKEYNTSSVTSRLEDVERSLSSVAQYYSAAADFSERLSSISIELRDILREAASSLDKLEADPMELERIEQRLNSLKTLFMKHHCHSSSELIALRENFAKQLKLIDGGDEAISQLEKQASKAHQEALSLATTLHERRLEAANKLSQPLQEQLKRLGVAGATFKIELKAQKEKLNDTGFDTVHFLFSANNQTALKPIAEIASGGEISRFMLALKTIMASHSTLPTIIFDEIDTGVSGHVAERMGRLMQSLGERLQVITITHLPQIAALAQHQMRVFKAPDSDGVYQTYLEPLDEEGRLYELAGMLSGSKLTDEALKNAKAFLDASQNKPQKK